MDYSNLLDYILHLRQKSDSHKLIIFVGAGVSKNVPGMLDWQELIQKMADAINYSRCYNCRRQTKNCEKNCNFKNAYSTDEYLKIPQYVFNANKDKYFSILSENIPSINCDVPLSSTIFDLNPVHIITTNYDKLLESSSNPLRNTFDVIINDRQLLNSTKTHYIIKMHGDIEHPETIVLKEDDYLAYSREHVLIEMFVKALLADHSILFLGYSMNDYNVKLIVNWLSYIKAQNAVIEETARIGYIIQDCDSIRETDQIYFQKNNIEIINLHSMPLIKNIPASIKHPIGQRLYSFLQTIHNPALEIELGTKLVYDHAVNFLKGFPYVELKNILSILCLQKNAPEYEKLTFFDCVSYDRLTSYLKSNTSGSLILAQLLVNAGIRRIEYNGLEEKEPYLIDNIIRNDLFNNRLYHLYLDNNYTELKEKATNTPKALSSYFYCSIFTEDMNLCSKLISSISFDSLSESEKVAFLFNKALHECSPGYPFDRKAIMAYIDNMSSKRVQDMYGIYKTIIGNIYPVSHSIDNSLEKLKDYYGPNCHFVGISSLTELYKIKFHAYNFYNFYFRNHVCFSNLYEYQAIIAPYIEAIMITNGESIEQPHDKSLFGFSTSRKLRYPLEIIDFDILTKSILPKELSRLLQHYNVKSLETSQALLNTVLNSFHNLAESMLSFSSFRRGHIVKAFLNYCLLLPKLPLSPTNKSQLSLYLTDILMNENFVSEFFSIYFYEWKSSLKIILEITQFAKVPPNFSIVESAIKSDSFWTYRANVNPSLLGKFFSLFLEPYSEETCTKLDNIILELEPEKQIALIELLGNNVSPTSIELYKNILKTHFTLLSPVQLLEFTCRNWIDFSEDNANALIDKVLEELNQNTTKKMHVFPNPLENTLQTIYIFYILGKIQDLSRLRPLLEDSIYLQFFLDDPSFSYEQIDFSDYMWQNIAKQSRFMDKIVLHKEQIIPIIQMKIDLNTATEFERKVLYGIFEGKNAILN